MAEKIKGITVSIGGDTKGLGKALAEVNQQMSSTQGQLKAVERLLKLDPTNTQLLAQKQRLLSEASALAAEKLEALQQAAATADEQLSSQSQWEQNYIQLQEQLEAVSSQERVLKARDVELKSQLENGQISTAEYEKLQTEIQEAGQRHRELQQAKQDLDAKFAGGRIDLSQYEGLQREIIATQQELEKLADRADAVGPALSQISDGAGKVSQAAAPLTAGIGALGAAAFATVPATEELRSDLSKLDNNARVAGVGVDAAREAFHAFSVVSDETDSSVEATANLLQAGFTESNLQEAVEGLAGAYLRFPDTLKVESLADSLQETLATGNATGQFGELLDRLGIGAESFSNSLALCTTEAQKQDMALSVLYSSGMMKTYEGWMQNNEALVESKQANMDLQESMAGLAEELTPIVTKASELVAGIVNWFTGLSDGAQGAIVTLLGVTAAVSPVAGAVSKVTSAMSGIRDGTKIASGAIKAVSDVTGGASGVFSRLGAKVLPALSTAFSFLAANPIVLVIAAIAAVVAIVVTLWNKCEWFRDGVTGLWDNIQNVFQAFDDWLGGIFSTDWTKHFGAFGSVMNALFANISNVWDSTKQVFSGVTTFIKGVFSGDWEMAWQGIVAIFGGIWDGLVAIAKAPINGVIGVINALIRGAADGINAVIDLINKLSITVPDWVPGIGGKHFGFDIQNIQAPQIPELAMGAVIQPNKPFAAILGDQTSGINIETPLSTMIQAFTSVIDARGVGRPMEITLLVRAKDSMTRNLLFELDELSSLRGVRLVKGV